MQNGGKRFPRATPQKQRPQNVGLRRKKRHTLRGSIPPESQSILRKRSFELNLRCASAPRTSVGSAEINIEPAIKRYRAAHAQISDAAQSAGESRPTAKTRRLGFASVLRRLRGAVLTPQFAEHAARANRSPTLSQGRRTATNPPLCGGAHSRRPKFR